MCKGKRNKPKLSKATNLTCLIMLAVLLLLVACVNNLTDNSSAWITSVRTNNSYDPNTFEFGDSLYIDVEYYLYPGIPYEWYEIYVQGGHEAGKTNFGGIRDETPTPTKNDTETKTFALLPGENYEGVKGRCDFYPEIWKYIELPTGSGLYMEAEGQRFVAPTSEKWYVNFPSSNPLMTDGIYIYCGNHRYGRPGEVLDYPVTYPLVVYVLDEYGNDIPSAGVKFTVVEGNAKLMDGPNEVTSFTTNTGYVEFGNPKAQDENNLNLGEGWDKLTWGAICSVVLKGEGLVKVEAEHTGSGDIATCSLMCVTDEEDIPVGEYDQYLFHENDDDDELILGDGLWGEYYLGAPHYKTIPIDRDEEAKNLRLEIDYVDNLGPEGCINLSSKDIAYIYDELQKIFNQVDIIFDPIYDPEDGPEYGEYNCSIVQKMNADPNWSVSEAKEIIFKEVDKYGQRLYTDEEKDLILWLTRGGVGEDGMGHWVRRRLHIVLLPGKDEQEPSVYGITRSMRTGTSEQTGKEVRSAEIASGVYGYPWCDEEATSTEAQEDHCGILIMTGALPHTSLINDTWLCKEDEEEVNPYCKILARLIAHEIGHALGLWHEENQHQIMYKNALFAIYHNMPYDDCGGMTEIDDENKKAGFFINMRKILGREVVNFRW